MRKMKKIIAIVTVSLLVISGVVLFALYELGDRILDEVIDQEIAQLEKNLDEPDTEGDLQQEATAEEETGAPEEDNTDGLEPGEADNTPQPAPNDDNAGGNTGTSNKTPSPAASTKPSTKQQAQKQEVAISVNKIKDVKEDVTAADKVSAAALVVKRLTASDINVLQDMLSGGLSAAEKTKAKSIAYARFSADEIKKIKEIYYKYMK